MTLPEWVEAVSGLVGKLSASPIRVSKRAITAASYLGISFVAAVAEVWRLGIATPLKELAESKLQKIKSVDIADAVKAHNEAKIKDAEAESIRADATKKIAESDEARARAEEARARARKSDAETSRLESAPALKASESRRLAAEREAAMARARLAAAVEKLKRHGGTLYLDPPREQDGPDMPDAQ